MKELITKKEKQIFELLILNYSTAEIAKQLNSSEKTIRNHISNVIQKLGVNNRLQALIELLKYNIISL